MVTVDALASLQQLRATFTGLAGGTPSSGDSTASGADFEALMAALTSSSGTANTVGDSVNSYGTDLTSSALAGSSVPASTTPGSLVSNGPATGADVVADAEKYIGVPYVLGGESSSGMDCSGLVQKTFADLGVSVSRLVHTQKLQGQAVDGLANAQPGDLIVFKGGGHIGIYAGNDMVIHAPYPGRSVSLQKLWVGDSGIETIRRIVPSTPASSNTTTTSSSGAPTLTQAQAALTAAQQAVTQADLAMMSSSDDPDSASSTEGASSTDSVSQFIAAQEALMTQGAS